MIGLLLMMILLPSAGRPPDAKDQVRQGMRAVGRVFVDGSAGLQPSGSGVVIAPEGVVLANFHQLTTPSGGLLPKIFFALPTANDRFATLDSSRLLELELIRFSQVLDLAILKIRNARQQFPVVPFADETKVAIMQTVYVLGYPEIGGDSMTVQAGIIAGKDARNQWFKLDTRLAHGDSGGAVLNEQGELVGVPTQKRLDIDAIGINAGVSDNLVTVASLDFVRRASLAGSMMASILVRHEVGGVVRSDQGPVPSVLVALMQGAGTSVTEKNLVGFSRSDEQGQFKIIAETQLGKHWLRAKAKGFVVLDMPLTLPSNSRVLDLRLRRDR